LTQALTTPSGGDVWHDWGGDGPAVHLAHANGFPPGTYRKLAEKLAERHHVVSVAARPLWSRDAPAELKDWSQLADDLKTELGRHGQRGVLAVGHSLGGVTSLLASADDPGLFRAVVAVDPLILTGRMSVFWGLTKSLGLGGRLGIVRGARSRRDDWPDRQAVLAAYRRKKIFELWDPEVLDDYISCGTVTMSDGSLSLRYPRAWEARIFEIAPHNIWSQLRRLRVPTLFVQGEWSDTFRVAAAHRAEKELPTAEVAVVPGSTHFVPMEKPKELGDAILEFLDRIDNKGGSR
jgi:pimeloyl-ACP methyl ester carboxylesterase